MWCELFLWSRFFARKQFSQSVKYSFIAGSVRTTNVSKRKITMKLDSEEFRSLFTPELKKLNDLFIANKFQLRMAGGAVRDLLMGLRPADIDFASDATPSQMKELFTREGIRMLNKNGEEHGTITCRIDDKENFEITTLRIDVVCDGRRAKVEFTTDWQLDANRRDLTINSLFLELDGTVIDYFGGIEDLRARRVAFVGDATQRIQEDYLRILRYFRFFGRIAKSGDAHEQTTLDAIINNKQGLMNISGERIWSELKKICVGRFGGDVLTTMVSRCGLASLLGLPEDCDVATCREIFNYNSDRSLEPMTVLSALFKNQQDIDVFHKRCKLSNAEKSLAEFIVEKRDEARSNIDSTKYFKDLILDYEKAPGRDKKKINGRDMVRELAKYVCASAEIIEEIGVWKMPEFPVSGKDLIGTGVKTGPIMRRVLTHLFELWKKSEYKAERDELLSHITPELVQVNDVDRPKKRGKKRRSEDSGKELEVKRGDDTKDNVAV
uniref:tRNA-nucleotidyltransferase 1 n=1 Tax=Ascaris suum TaxID=6253 RepID=F1L3Q5_ASCSU